MKYVIFSDIHNNDHALSTVLRDAYQRHIDAYLCLGDIGLDPCLQQVRHVDADRVYPSRLAFDDSVLFTLFLMSLRAGGEAVSSLALEIASGNALAMTCQEGE
jgi:hypothetical protein